MFTKKLKNPVSVIRKPEEINKEYSDLVVKLGSARVELAAIKDSEEKQATRKEQLAELELEILMRVTELSVEMQDSQAEELRQKEKQETTSVIVKEGDNYVAYQR